MKKFNVGGLALAQPFRIRRIGHIGYHSPAIGGTVDFLSNLLGLVPTDVDDFTSRVPGLPKEHATGMFLRCGTDHHTVVIGSQMLVDTREPHRKGALLGQLSWQVGSLKEVVDGVHFLDENAKLRRIGRDAPGSNWHAYAYDPDGYINEVFYGMEQIGWDGRSKPESMYDRAFHTLPELPQIPEYREVEIAAARGDKLDGYRYEQGEQPAYDVEGVMMPRPFKLTRLGRIGLFVNDLAASVRFYTEVMGLKLTQYASVRGHTCAFLRADAEHHTLALMPKALEDESGFGASYGMAVATYQQLRDAYSFLKARGVRMLDVPADFAPGVPYGFWVQGPDRVAVHLYYGMECVDRHGQPTAQPVTTPPIDTWPEAIEHGDAAWFEPAFMGPLA